MDLLLAGPGTGKTHKVKELLRSEQPNSVLVLSFTNATINDLLESFQGSEFGIDESNCMTLHKYSLLINHLDDFQVLDGTEERLIEYLAQKIKVPVDYLHTTLKCITFQKMIEDCTAYVNANPKYAQDKIGELELLIVDEFQDFNDIERQLIYTIARRAKRTIILGDDDQAIYDFKDADAAELVGLYNNPDVNKLEHENICYRCPDEVVACASKLISTNKQRVSKVWKPNGKDGFCRFDQYRDHQELLTELTTTIKTIYKQNPGQKPSVMILSPSKFTTVGVATHLVENGIAATDWTTKQLADEKLADAAYLKFALGSHRLLNLYIFSMMRGMTPYRKNKLHSRLATALNDGFDESEILTNLATNHVYSDDINNDILTPPDHSELLQRPHFLTYASLFENADAPGELRRILQRLGILLRDVTSETSDADCVNIMSIHRSKGLQADYVFIVGLVNGVLPNKNRGLTSYEAQRRLLFVGMTRAKKGLSCISTIEWPGGIVNKFDKSQFSYSYKTKTYEASTSDFIKEILKT